MNPTCTAREPAREPARDTDPVSAPASTIPGTIFSATPPAPASCHAVAEPEALPPGARQVHSLKEALRTDDTVRWIGAGRDLDFPPVPFPSRRVLALAGADTLRAVATRHHRLLRHSAIGHLFPADDATFERITARVADFIVEACGGTDAYTRGADPVCMRTRHLPFSIDEAARETWLDALWQAMHEAGLPPAVHEEYWAWLEAMSIRMINRRTTRSQPPRRPYAQQVAAC